MKERRRIDSETEREEVKRRIDQIGLNYVSQESMQSANVSEKVNKKINEVVEIA